MLTDSQLKQTVIDIVGACDLSVRAFLEGEINNIWCLARMEGCRYPMLFLIAQRYAIDAALDRAAFLFDTAKGGSTQRMNNTYAGFNKSVSASHGESQSWGCDWSDSSSFREYQRRADAHSRAKDYSTSVETSQSFMDGTDKSTSNAQGSGYGFDKSDGTRDSNAQSTTMGRSHAESESDARSGKFTPDAAAAPKTDVTSVFDGSIDLPPVDIPPGAVMNLNLPIVGNVQIPSNTISKGSWLSLPVNSILGVFGASASDVDPMSNGLGSGTVLPSPGGEPYCEEDDTFSLCSLPDGESSQSAAMTIWVPIIIGSLSFTVSNDVSAAHHPSCERAENSSFSLSHSDSAQESHSLDESHSKDDSESNSSDVHNVHRYGESHREGEAHAASMSNSVGQGFAEAHDGSDRAAHGEGQSSSLTETTADYTFRANGVGDESFDASSIAEKKSQVFDGLKAMRVMVQSQIDQAYAAVSAGRITSSKYTPNKTTCFDPCRYWLGRIVSKGCCTGCGQRVCTCGCSRN